LFVIPQGSAFRQTLYTVRESALDSAVNRYWSEPLE
jgi:hypothetical protein